MELPDDLPVVERVAVRVVLVDRDERVLLLHTRDATYPELGQWWELPGGGLEPGESISDAAVREIAEETGLVVAASRVGAATWRRRATFRYHGRRYLQDEHVVVAHVDGRRPPLDPGGRVGFEGDDYVGHRWWALDDLTATSQRCYPGRLPDLVVPFLRGEAIDEPFEAWS